MSLQGSPDGPALLPSLTERWWHPDQLSARRATLTLRTKARQATRAWFEAGGFEETETPALQICPGMEVHLAAFSTDLCGPHPDDRLRLYLHTSPEFTMKKLLAGGLERIYQLAPVYRNGERSPLHHPAFSMLEWYRAYAGYRQMMEDCIALVRSLCQAVGLTALRRGAASCDPFAEWEVLSVADAFDRYAGIDLLATAPDPLRPDPALLAHEANRIGVRTAASDSWDDVFFRISLERIEPFLGLHRPVFLTDYPVSMAALARPKPEDFRLAERFELYACGVELANAFGELTDPHLQRRRFEADMQEKQRLYGVSYPIDEDFIDALALMPPSAGIALGFDRLVMLLAGAESIEQTLWAPVAMPRQAPCAARPTAAVRAKVVGDA
jgi:elongation factor P--(R)-beta-lysine ligase